VWSTSSSFPKGPELDRIREELVADPVVVGTFRGRTHDAAPITAAGWLFVRRFTDLPGLPVPKTWPSPFTARPAAAAWVQIGVSFPCRRQHEHGERRVLNRGAASDRP